MNRSKKDGMPVLRFITILQDIFLHSLLKTCRDTFQQKNVAPIPCGRHLAVEIHPLTPASGGQHPRYAFRFIRGRVFVYAVVIYEKACHCERQRSNLMAGIASSFLLAMTIFTYTFC
ncbi:MAG: hypothetical protein F9K48_01150 [Candidatus Brocadia sp.]|nr:MAG: hypothetical protein F9K48_01150 [Candidatus Brocadia sp.]